MALYLYSGPPFEGIFRLKMGPFSAPLHTKNRRKPLRGALFIENSSVSVHYLRDPPGVGANRAAWSPPHPPKGRWPLPMVDSGALPASQPVQPARRRCETGAVTRRVRSPPTPGCRRARTTARSHLLPDFPAHMCDRRVRRFGAGIVRH